MRHHLFAEHFFCKITFILFYVLMDHIIYIFSFVQRVVGNVDFMTHSSNSSSVVDLGRLHF